jgi:hypothetical protein
LVNIWQTIKKDRQRHVHLLKEALEKEIHGWYFCLVKSWNRV